MMPGEAPEAIKKVVKDVVRESNHKTMQKAFRVSNAMRNSVIEVLTNPISDEDGKPMPSPAGSPPGIRHGFLRRAWKCGVRNKGGSGGGVSIVAFADAKAHYAGYLEDGTRKMDARPFVDPILEDVEPEVNSIFSDF